METIDRKFKILAVNPCKGTIYTEKDAVLFCAKDKAVPGMLQKYYDECFMLGCDDVHLSSITKLIERVNKFQADVESRVPDTDEGCESDRCLGGVGVDDE